MNNYDSMSLLELANLEKELKRQSDELAPQPVSIVPGVEPKQWYCTEEKLCEIQRLADEKQKVHAVWWQKAIGK